MPVISRDGRVVAFNSAASDLVGGDGNGVTDAFIRELASGTTRRVSVNDAGVEANGPSGESFDGSGPMTLSGDGRFVGFTSSATNLASDTNGVRDVFGRQELFAPSVVSPPSVSGSAARGAMLTGARGSWAGTPEISFAYQWQRCDDAGSNCLSLAGTPTMSYAPGDADVGHTLRFRVRARNDAATVWRTSVATKPVAAG
jgi:hypothetical protein